MVWYLNTLGLLQAIIQIWFKMSDYHQQIGVETTTINNGHYGTYQGNKEHVFFNTNRYISFFNTIFTLQCPHHWYLRSLHASTGHQSHTEFRYTVYQSVEVQDLERIGHQWNMPSDWSDWLLLVDTPSSLHDWCMHMSCCCGVGEAGFLEFLAGFWATFLESCHSLMFRINRL